MAEFLQIPLALIARDAENIPALYQKSSYKNVDTLPSGAFYLYLKKYIFRSVDGNITEPEYAL